MSIRFTKYIDITSGVGGASVLNAREYIGRLFTTNPLLPPQSFIEFTTPAQVLAYFGSTSVEYLRALFYFSWISKNITSPQKISFARWANVAVAPLIFGATLTTTLTALQLITNGSFSLTIGGVTNVISGLDFSSDGSLTAIAATIETAIRAETGTQWTAATVTYDSTTGAFNFVGGVVGAANISVAIGNVGTDISSLIGWLPESINGSNGAIWSNGSAIETITQTLTNSDAASDNFGSFLFIPALDNSQVVEAATWNQSLNIKYEYQIPSTTVENCQTLCNLTNGLLLGLDGAGVTYAPISTEFDEQVPMMIQAATNYSGRNSTQNYMFQRFPGLTPKVTDDTTSDTLDAIRVNYYGQTQSAGQQLAFYQRGFLMGGATAAVDMNTYANEIWLKDAAGAAIMNLFLAVAKVPANLQGVSKILVVLQDVIDQALNNGTISVNGFLSTQQKLYITEVTGDPNAWYQVLGSGYWVTAVIAPLLTDAGVTEYQILYTLVYKKDDVVRSVSGTHILI
jgi:hypothetical protein